MTTKTFVIKLRRDAGQLQTEIKIKEGDTETLGQKLDKVLDKHKAYQFLSLNYVNSNSDDKSAKG